jgi:hypothetical protein
LAAAVPLVDDFAAPLFGFAGFVAAMERHLPKDDSVHSGW